MKKVALKPYLSKIGLAYVKSPFLLSSKPKIMILPLLLAVMLFADVILDEDWL
jgi:hypothetical protein